MTQPEAMSVEEKLDFVNMVEKIRGLRLAEPDVRLSKAQKALLSASDHIQALERRNENLAELHRKQEVILDGVMRFMQSLRTAYSVARDGTLVGEVTALGTTLRDLQRALGLDPDQNEDGDPA